MLGGGKVKKEYPYTLVIKENRESFRTSKMLETVVNERFHQTEDGHQKGVATAKTDSYLVLKVPRLYHQNQEHFFRVVQLLPMIDSPELRARRIAAWSKELLDPKTAGVAAMKLEGLGTTAIESLKAGLKSPNRAGPILLRRGAGLPQRYRGRRGSGRDGRSISRTFGPMPWRPWPPWTSPHPTSSCAS